MNKKYEWELGIKTGMNTKFNFNFNFFIQRTGKDIIYVSIKA